ncbi:MAG: hypothetical protein ACLPYS_04160, partial [Vulcanimicrobiaceae bacterium]
GCPNRALHIRGHMKGLPSLTQGGSPVPESGSPGFVRGAHSNMRPYRDISEAIRAGFQIYDKTADGYIARILTTRGWAMALIDLKQTG